MRIGVVLLTILFNAGLICTDSSKDDSRMPSLTNELDILDDHLSNIILPTNYDINLKITDNDIFHGTVSIRIEISEPRTTVSFHTQNLVIDYENIILRKVIDNTQYQLKGHIRHPSTRVTSLIFHTLFEGNYILTMQYTGNIEENLGFVKIKHNKWDTGNTISYITVLEPNGARRVFPCWDEPKFKTTFDIAVEHKPGYYVFSNTKQQMSVQLENRVLTRFQTTYYMPAYLVTIGILHSVYGYTTDDKIWFSKQLTQESSNRLRQIVIQTDEYLMNYTDNFWRNLTTNVIAFPELPSKIIGGWQCAVFRDSDIVDKPIWDFFSPTRDMWRIVTYGLVRNCIESVVTPSKFSHLWFSKALEFQISYNILKKHYNTEWITHLYVVQVLLPALHNDIVFNVPPIEHKYDLIYSSLIYRKAFAIIFMLEKIVKEDAFQQAVAEYINKYAYIYATPTNFFDILNTVILRLTNKHPNNITDLMTGWLSYKGYPTLLVKRYYNNRTIILSYDNMKNNLNKHKDWVIPVTYITQEIDSDYNTLVLWSGNKSSQYYDSITFPVIDNNDWILLNEYGYYRVNYDNDNWLKIANYLNHNLYWKISPVTRARIIDDAYHFVIEKRMKATTYFALITYLKRETHFIVWHAVMNTLTYMSPFFKFRESNNFTDLMLFNMNNVLMNIDCTKDDEESMLKFLRLLLLKWTCKHGDQMCRQIANFKLIVQLDEPKKHEKYWMDWLLCAGLMNTRNDTWEKIKQNIAYKDDMENIKYLACNENDDMIVELLKSIIFKPDNKWPQLSYIQLKKLYDAIIKKHANKNKVLNFLLENFDSIFPSYMTKTEKINNIIVIQNSKCYIKKISNYVKNNLRDEERTIVTSILIKQLVRIEKQRNTFMHIFTQNVNTERC
ncbi:thyrotropin-releasing hormone-degrading ectoenzyme-like [Odontomachus brunneus]|uniref:thyrotropin-releasing hormone-degrading ectoenzyme-like n=1 Tax=Odontomachus brunneus TaxID=486640 RepID=UPI0013F2AB8D|nr:thyrotropin-releasing hormone-degrading ectoenzyme-like [Odontomachus brunneus]